MWRVAIVLPILLFPILASAHGNGFFEFNPDAYKTSSLLVATGDTPYEIFVAQNDFLDGFDLWASNANTPSDLTVTLYNSQSTQLSTKTIALAALADIAGGHKIHLDLPGQLAVSNTNPYSLKITSTSPKVRLYYANRTEVLQHNAPYPSTYQNGVARLGTEEKDFSFKFGLYEITETAPPVVTNMSAQGVSQALGRVQFNANEPVDYRLDYSIQGQAFSQLVNYTSGYSFCLPGISLCQIDAPAQAGQTYAFQLTVKDVWGNQTTATGTFTTPADPSVPAPTLMPTASQPTSPTPTALPDSTAPVVTDLRIAAVTDKTVTVAWTTNEAADSYLLIQYSSNFLTITDKSDETLELEHTLTTSPVLGATTPYYAKITSRDGQNNASTQTIEFTTSAIISTPTPNPTQNPNPQNSSTPTPTPSPEVITQTSNDNTTISWNPPSGAGEGGYRVDVFDELGRLVKQVVVPVGTTSTNLKLPKGNYRAIVYEKKTETDTLEKVAPAKTFTSQGSPLTRMLAIVIGAIALGAGLGYLAVHRLRAKPKPPTLPNQSGPPTPPSDPNSNVVSGI